MLFMNMIDQTSLIFSHSHQIIQLAEKHLCILNSVVTKFRTLVKAKEIVKLYKHIPACILCMSCNVVHKNCSSLH